MKFGSKWWVEKPLYQGKTNQDRVVPGGAEGVYNLPKSFLKGLKAKGISLSSGVGA